jgi:uncharacterized protein DUF72
MPRAKTAKLIELTPEERRERRRLRREKQREDNVKRAAKMHAARLKSDATNKKLTSPRPKQSIFVGCSGWRYWKWRDTFYDGVPQNDWFGHYLKNFDTVEINASFYSWPTVAGVQAWRRQPGKKKFVYTIKVCETHHPHQEIQGYQDSRQGFRDDFGYPRRSNGLLPVSVAAKLPLHQNTPQRYYQPARSGTPQRRRIRAH